MILKEKHNQIFLLRRNITVKDIRTQLSHSRGFGSIFHVTNWDTLPTQLWINNPKIINRLWQHS